MHNSQLNFDSEADKPATVWVLTSGVPYEPETLVGIFTTQQKAIDAAKAAHMSPIEVHIEQWQPDVGLVCGE